jgi:uncharacterized protein (TIGR04255 family)
LTSDTYEIYPNAPIQLVAFEARFPFTPRLTSPDTLATIHELLAEQFPIVEQVNEQMVTVSVGGADSPLPVPAPRSVFRMFTRAKTTLVSLTGDNLTIETSDYGGFGKFLAAVESVLSSVAGSAHPFGLERIGLRYVDEIRVPTSSRGEAADWEPYVHHALLTAGDLADLVPQDLVAQSWQGAVQFGHDEQRSVVLRFGSLNGLAVTPEGPLKLARQFEPSPFFLLDIDSFWSRKGDEVSEFDASAIVDLTRVLHAPIRALFEAVITEQLRNEVLRKEVAT